MVTPELRDMKKSFIVGVGGVAFLAFLVYIAFNAQGGLSSLPLIPKTTVRAAFKNSGHLQSNDLVRQGGIRIGAVQSVDYRNGESIVTMRLDFGGHPFYKNATAAIWELNALGTKYVELTPGTRDAGALGDGVIPVSQTENSYDLYQVLGIFDEKTRSSAQAMLQQVGGGMLDQGGNFHDFLSKSDQMLPDFGTVSDALASKQADLPTLLASADRLTSRLQSRSAEIASLISQTNATFEAINVDHDLDATLHRAPQTLASAKTALDHLEHPLGDAEVTMREIKPGADSLAVSEPILRGVLREGIRPLDKVPSVAKQTKPAVESLTDTFSDLRPLAPQVANTFERAATPLRIIEPYATSAGQLFVRLASFVSLGSSPGNRYAYINVNPSLGTLTSATTGSCNIAQNNYPKPGQATGDRKSFGLPSGTSCLNGRTPPSISEALQNALGSPGGHK
jgi:phospholipid/cholesterol/gamma-HCH transport system substrate-binding protein